ncbi:MAG: DNA polymerase I [Chlamydiia bacterium]|nr:DNA polymerase I [Chlamydiia bacterium]
MIDKIYIIDAVNYLFRSYYAIGPMTNPKGESTSALFGFIRSIQKLIKEFSPKHLICVFDGPDNKKSRHALYADYKMHRKGAPADLYPQFEWASQYCSAAGIPLLCIEGVEADDTMAAIATWVSRENGQSFICTSDKDMMQLVNPHIFLLHAHKDNALIDANRVEEIYGVKPGQMLDLLAMMGDASDNIPGIPGFGPKTAASLLQEFGTLDAILAHPEKVKGEKKQQLIQEHKESALMSRKLASLDTGVPIPHDELFYQLKESDKATLATFYHDMGFLSLLKEIQNGPIVEALKPQTVEKQEYILVDDATSLNTLLQRLKAEQEVGIDTETTDISPFLAELVGIGFCVEPGTAWYVPCNGQLGKHYVQKELQEFFATTNSAFFGHNLKYDRHVLQNHGMPVKQISFDTMLASYLLEPHNRRHNLDEVSLEKLKKVKIPIESLIGKGKTRISMADAPVEKVKDYCCEDIDYTSRLKSLFSEALHVRQLERIFYDIELPLLPILAKMEQTGIFLDVEKLHEIQGPLAEELNRAKNQVFASAGEEFNLNSPKQLSQILFQKLGLKQPAHRKTEFSTAADVLEELAEEHLIAQEILHYRLLEKLRSTYIEALPQLIHPKTGRIHCTFNQSVTATGRLSCQDPNLQNIPIRSKEGMAIRSCFRPQKPQWSYLGADYSQIELRLLAHFSEDPSLVRAFQTGQDIHTHTAALVFDVPLKEVTTEMRNAAKTVNFGILYGQGPYGLSKQLQISMAEASRFIKTYFERYPRVQAYLEACKESVKKTGISKTLTGRQRPIPEIHNKNPSIRAAAERFAVNTPLQGSQADLIKMAMIGIDRAIEERNLQGKMILQIHDELIFEIPDSEIEIFQKLVKEKMENVFTLNIPIEVHISVGKNWAEC